MIKRFALLILIPMLFYTCKKDSFTPVKVTYLVEAADSSSLNITYNSDYYFDSGTLKTINYLSNGGTWSGVHTANKEEEYYIKVEYLNAVHSETNFTVRVFFNDTLAVDSSINNMVVPLVELKGMVHN
jgi:hypothetical protein